MVWRFSSDLAISKCMHFVIACMLVLQNQLNKKIEMELCDLNHVG